MNRLVASLTMLLVAAGTLRAQSRFVVHEWGTFTTLEGSDGGFLTGLYHEEERLPIFVYSNDYNNGLNKGYFECSGVSVKMETPVIYFYSDSERIVHTHVSWPAGSISQWYPSRDSGDYLEMSPADTAHFENTPWNGWIDWTVRVRAKSAMDTLGMAKADETHTWQAPRATDANVIQWPAVLPPNSRIKPTVEKYLFYRGIGNVSSLEPGLGPLLRIIAKDDTLTIQNQTYYQIPFAMVFEKTADSVKRVWWMGPIRGAQSKPNIVCPPVPMAFDDAIAIFRDSLVAAGLYRKEADAMIDTWRQSYFERPGLRVFWIYPRMSTDRSLPLTITPEPDSTERVLVARSEVLTPAFERTLLQQFAREDSTGRNNFSGDRYYLAYKERVNQLRDSYEGVSVADRRDDVQVFPNPVTSILNIAPATTRVMLTDMLGRSYTLLTTGSGSGSQCDLSGLPRGTYMLRFERNGSVAARIVERK